MTMNETLVNNSLHSTIGLKTVSGRFACAEKCGVGLVVVSFREAIGPWETFTLGCRRSTRLVRLGFEPVRGQAHVDAADRK
jgi:hypothetical protein